MTQSLAVPYQRQIAIADEGLQPFVRLDPFAADGIAVQAGRVGPLGVVSLGYMMPPKEGEKFGRPRASQSKDDHWLHLTDPEGRCPGLAKALEEGKWRKLTITFPRNRGFIQQAFTKWSTSALEAYGDATGLRQIRGDNHVWIPAGTDEYDNLVRQCKAETRMYFALARWLPEPDEQGMPQSEVYFPDGFGYYAFKTTGRHSAAELMGYLESFGGFTGGRVAGIPFDLDVVFRQVAGREGKKQTVPVVNLVTRPPAHIVLSSRTFRQLAVAGLEQGENMLVPMLPSAEDIAHEGPVGDEADPSDEQVERLAAGDSPCDYLTVVRTWHAVVRGTPLEAPERRAQWLRDWSQAYFEGEATFESLTAVRSLTIADATQLIADLSEGLAEVRESYPNMTEAQRNDAKRYEDIFGNEKDGTVYDQENAIAPSGPATVGKPAQPQPAQTEDVERITKADDPVWIRWERLVAEARRYNVNVPDVRLGVATYELRAVGNDLLANVKLRKKQLADEDAARKAAGELL